MGTVGERIGFGGGMLFEPSASVIYSHVHQNGFTEADGGGADLAVAAQSQDAVQSVLQARISRSYALASGAVLRAAIKAGWAHDFESTSVDSAQAFAAAGSPTFVLAGADPGRNAGLFGASLSLDLSKRLSFFGRYDGAYGDRATNHAVSVGFNMVW